MIALVFSEDDASRNFQCSKCPEETKKLRRCEEDRWDFTSADGPSVFPVAVAKGGPYFPFCPGKATWDHELSEVFKLLEICYHTGQLPYSGALLDQPSWFVDLLHIFLTQYDEHRFYSRQKKMWGSKDKKAGKGAKSSGRKIGK